MKKICLDQVELSAIINAEEQIPEIDVKNASVFIGSSTLPFI